MGLSISVSNSGLKRRQYRPDAIARLNSKSTTNLIAWYDFSDASTIFEDTAGTDPAETGDTIEHVTNKAYDGLGASSKALNKFIITTTTKRPTWTYSSGVGYATFDGTDDLLQSSIIAGQVSTGKMSGSDLLMDSFTISIIVKRSTSATPSAMLQMNAFSDTDRRDASIVLDSRDGYVMWSPQVDRNVVSSGTASTTDIVHYTIMGGSDNTSANVTRIFRNGVQIGSTSTGDWTGDNLDLTANNVNVMFTLGDGRNYAGTGEAYSGRIYEYIQYDKALTKLQFAQLNGYYGQKYNL